MTPNTQTHTLNYLEPGERDPWCLGRWLCGGQRALTDRWGGFCSRYCKRPSRRSRPPLLQWALRGLPHLNPGHTEKNQLMSCTWLLCTRDKIVFTSTRLTASRMPAVLLWLGSARTSTGLRKNRRPQMREALFLLSSSFSPGGSRAVFSISSVRRFLGLGKSERRPLL